LRATFHVAALLAICSGAFADDTLFEPSAIIDDYVVVSQAQQSRLQGASMEVDIEAELPKLHKSGRLHGLRRISTLGRITYDALRFEGDRSIKNDVIARYLSAESEAIKAEPAALAVTPVNYKFKYKGLIYENRLRVYVFHVSPRKKRLGLFVGELWLDPDTHLPVRESGRLVKSPSIFLRKVEFVRDYRIQNGVAIPTRIQSWMDTRLVGIAKLAVQFSSVSLAGGAEAGPAGDSE
jgi:hypothetical protein